MFFICILFTGCGENFLEEKPNSSIINPKTLAEFQTLLDNDEMLNSTGGLAQMAADEYFVIDKTTFDALQTPTEKGSYLWSKDLYGKGSNVSDWNRPYKAIFYANSVIDGLNALKVNAKDQVAWNNLKGSALFFRAYAFHDLARSFCPVYNENTADKDLGLPLKKSSGIDVILQRSSLKDTYNQIVADLNEALPLLRDDFSTPQKNRPSKTAVTALLARIYLYMGKYNEAEKAANACLEKYNTLIDYNKISTDSDSPFANTSDETIFFSRQIVEYYITLYTTYILEIGVNPTLLALYEPNDLRLQIFYEKNKLNNYNVKRGYVKEGVYAFTGLAVDEIMLIKAECAARRNDPTLAISLLNTLLTNRYKTGTFEGLRSMSSTDALQRVLLERQKELVWRALRWSDLKRLNRDGANITLRRKLGDIEYSLSPNSPNYTFPIPLDEINLGGIQQNIRQ